MSNTQTFCQLDNTVPHIMCPVSESEHSHILFITPIHRFNISLLHITALFLQVIIGRGPIYWGS